MKTSSTILLTIISLFISIVGTAQEHYLPGYIITKKSDTLRGAIDYRNWERSPEIIFFRTTPESPRQGYSPLDIKGFVVADEIYVGAIVQTEISLDKEHDLQYNNELIMKTDTAFLQTMVRGKKCLYSYINRFGKELFYIRTDATYDLLVYKKYLKDQDGKTMAVENKRFIGQLTLYLPDCPSIQKKLQSTEYTKNSLEQLFNDYYAATGGTMNFQKKTENSIFEFGVLAGMTMTSLKFTSSDSYPELVNAGFPVSYNFAAGLFMDIILSRSQSKWSVNNELTFTSYKVDGYYEDVKGIDYYTNTSVTLGYAYLKLNNMLRFKYPLGKVFVYADAGISNGYAVYEKNYQYQVKKFHTQETITEGKALNETRRYEFGILAGAGARVGHFSLEARYLWGNGMSPYTTLTSSTNVLCLFLGYRF